MMVKYQSRHKLKLEKWPGSFFYTNRIKYKTKWLSIGIELRLSCKNSACAGFHILSSSAFDNISVVRINVDNINVVPFMQACKEYVLKKVKAFSFSGSHFPHGLYMMFESFRVTATYAFLPTGTAVPNLFTEGGMCLSWI